MAGRRVSPRWFFSLLAIILAYYLQRGGYLFHGSSYHLPHADQRSPLKRALMFRNIFYSYALQENFDSESISKMILFPSDELANLAPYARSFVHPDDVPGALGKIEKTFQKTNPSSLYDKSENMPFVHIEKLESTLRFSKAPVTLVLYPGVLSEMVSGSAEAFDDFFTSERNPKARSTYERVWLERFQGYRLPEHRLDKVFSIRDLNYTEVPLTDLMDIASIDAADGTPLVRLVRFRPVMGSLETMGTLKRSAEIYLRRLTKFYTIMGKSASDDAIYLIGYSRGSNVALEMLVRGRQHIYPWASRIRGVISLGGVLYGTESADTLLKPGHVNYEGFHILLNCSRQLDFSHEGDLGSWGHAREVAKNAALWVESGVRLLALAASVPDNPADKEFVTKPPFPYSSLSGILYSLLFEKFKLGDPVTDYYPNLKRFKLLMNAVHEAFMGLTTPARLEWWATTTIPTDVQYFALPATMPDAIPSFMTSLSYDATIRTSHVHTELTFMDSAGKEIEPSALTSHDEVCILAESETQVQTELKTPHTHTHTNTRTPTHTDTQHSHPTDQSFSADPFDEQEILTNNPSSHRTPTQPKTTTNTESTIQSSPSNQHQNTNSASDSHSTSSSSSSSSQISTTVTTNANISVAEGRVVLEMTWGPNSTQYFTDDQVEANTVGESWLENEFLEYEIAASRLRMSRDISYSDVSSDYHINRIFFYELLRESRKQLNDGQVPADKSIFWPVISQALNPNQANYHASILGFLGSHHWSLAMPRIFDDHMNPFPREILLKSIATFLAYEQ